MPDGTILTADVKNAPNSEIYNPATGQWKSAGSTVVDLRSPGVARLPQIRTEAERLLLPPGEIGPAILRPDGSVFATGSGTGTERLRHRAHRDLHTRRSGTWTAGPDFPNNDNAGDS